MHLAPWGRFSRFQTSGISRKGVSGFPSMASFFTLEAGDLIFTGTPAGVGALLPGDQVKAGIEGLGEIEIEIGG